jgi:hypothetical protein
MSRLIVVVLRHFMEMKKEKKGCIHKYVSVVLLYKENRLFGFEVNRCNLACEILGMNY